MATPQYVRRIARLPEVFARLASYPHGVSLRVLANEVGVDHDELRDDLLTYFATDLLGLSRPHALQFRGSDGDDDIDPNDASIVQLVDPPDDLGVELLDASELALVYTAAMGALELDPDDTDLLAAINVIAETLYGGSVAAPQPWRPPHLDTLQAAATDHRAVRIVYSRQWRVGVTERVIHPYRLMQTSVRGWEVDAGPVQHDGSIRSFLLTGIREVEVLDEIFESPADLRTLLDAQRSTSTVRLVLPHDARWALDEYAEAHYVVDDTDDTIEVDAELLPPVAWRVGLLMLAGGVDVRVPEPASLIAEGPGLARQLLEHHRR
ncbi:helix-turn-helix transcriptional regulator [Nocardioides limicola]|uniref:helix-turn-helix transcriptional regulator n=1 Tax=Nocardioides limicola TaxID=2803368 RepID=UPI00193B2CC1|nr:WYL domain-containing protein [Nocardioides sp. DJM-14]